MMCHSGPFRWQVHSTAERIFLSRPPNSRAVTRQLTEDIHWLCECGPNRLEGSQTEVHVPQHAYLLVGDEYTLLFDTLSPAATETVLESLETVLGNRPLDYLLPSHPDVPHAGNTGAIQTAYPDVELLAPRYGEGHGCYHLEAATRVGAGDTLDLGGLEVAFHPAPFPDAPIHCWMSERTTGTLFTVDFFGYPHFAPGECHAFAEDLDLEVSVARLTELHEFVLFWLKYADSERTRRAIDRIITEHDPAILAPAHGNPIREEPTAHLERMKEVVDRIALSAEEAHVHHGGER